MGPGWGVGPSDCAEEVGAGGGVVGGGEVSMGWAHGDGVEVVEDDEGGGGAAAAAAAAAAVVSVWEDESLGRACQTTGIGVKSQFNKVKLGMWKLGSPPFCG